MFDECPVRYTRKMWLDDLERLTAESGALSPSNPCVRYPLLCAAQRGRVDVVQILLDRGMCHKDDTDPGGNTASHIAALAGHAGVVRALLAAGADSLRTNHSGVLALDLAIGHGNLDVVKVFIEHGADLHLGIPLASDGETTCLHLAAVQGRADVVSLLCLSGVDANAENGSGWTPLHMAANRGEVGATQALLAAGANAAIRNGDVSPLAAAAAGGHGDVVRAILQHLDDVDSSGPSGETALHFAANHAKPEVVEILLGAGADAELADSDGNTPLHAAAYQSCPAAVTALLNRGAKIDTKESSTGLTALHMAATRAGTPDTATVVDILLRRGANETAVDTDDRTPADVVGSKVEESQETNLAEDAERVRELLANAPADRAWRRRGVLVLCRAHYPGGRVRLGCNTGGGGGGVAKRTSGSCDPAEQSRTEADWADVASMLMGAGSDPVSLMGDGADIIFETIVGFL